MPGVFYVPENGPAPCDPPGRTPADENVSGGEPLSRKEFLRRALFWSAAGATWLSLPGSSTAAPEKEWTVALLADTHVPEDPSEEYRGFRPTENLKQVVPQICQSAAQAAFLLGDAARLAGLPGDYRMLKKLLGPVSEKMPVVIGLGNHDNRRNFFAQFPPAPEAGEQSVSGKHVVVVEHQLLRVVMLDSLLYVNKVAGLLGKAQREWLARWLPTATDRPVVLMVHHTLGDGDGDLLDVDRLMRIVEPHPQVKAIFYGHSHTYRVTQRNRLQLVNLSACGYNFSDSEPVGWTLARFDARGVNLTLHAVGGNKAQDGKTRRVDWLR